MKRNLYVLTCALCTLLSLPVAAQVPGYVPTDGLVGWWPFNGNANDESGNGNDGVVNGATLTEDRFGNVNSAFEFDGSASYIEVMHSGSITAQNEITISCWINANIINNGFTQTLISKGMQSNYWNYGISITSNGIASYNYTNYGIGSNYLLNSNTWHHLLFSINETSNTMLEFIDGVYQTTLLNVNTNQVTTNFTDVINSCCAAQLNFGKNSGGQAFYGGLIDDIAIYNRALTEQEIQNLYTGTTPEQCTSLPSNLQQGLVGYWPFCGNANDESGNGNDGTVNGATLTEDRFGNANAAYGFDGVDDFISVSNSESIDIQSEITIAAWVKTNSIESSRPTIVCKERFENGIKYMLSIQPETGNVGIAVNNDPSTNCSACDQEIWSNESLISESWQHVSASWDNEILKVYVNGVLSQTGEGILQGGVLQTSPSTPLLFGKAFTSIIPIYSTQFQGSLDDIAIYNRALTPEEVQELYTLDACTFTVFDTTYVTVYDTLTTYETVYDTLYTYETIYDTVTTYVTVTDTLLIDITFTGIEGQPSWLTTVTVFPNPASDHITIDYGNFALLAGYNTIITDAAGATVYSSAVNSQQAYIDINAWGAAGVYYLTIYDASGAPVAVRHIVLE
jgi:hypothetical protein